MPEMEVERTVSLAPHAELWASPPPLRIHHLMAWTAVTAALISGCMWFDRTARNGLPITDRLVIAGLVSLAISVSAAFTYSMFAVYWWDHGIRVPRSPGDFLLSMITKSALFFCGAFAGIFVIFFATGGDDLLRGYYFLAGCIAFVAWLRTSARGFAQYADTRPWRVAFWILVVMPGVVFIVTILAGVQLVFSIAVLVACLLYAMYDDVCRRMQRSWTHWLGCFTTVAFGLALAAVFHN